MAINNQQKVGILLVNMGTPRAPTEEAIREYLKEFLSDPAVVDLPRWIWFFILNFIILKKRPQKLAVLYQKIWTAEGSPLYAISLRQQRALKKLFESEHIYLEIGMRYGQPSLKNVLTGLKKQGIDRLILLPLFPHYSNATVGNINDYVQKCVGELGFKKLNIKSIRSYYQNHQYNLILKKTIEEYWRAEGKGERLLFSYHGLPLSSADCLEYFQQCKETTNLVATSLNLQAQDYQLCFQSRFGFAEWLQPYTDQLLVALAKKGVKKIDIICPGFSADCLETLEEVKIQYAEKFNLAGGEKLNYIPCLNDSPYFIEFLKDLIFENIDN